MTLSQKKTLCLLKAEKARYKLDEALCKGLVKDNDLINLLKMPSDFGITNDNLSYKDKLLKDVFNSPFILCDQENLSLNVKQFIPIFLNNRYQAELEELDSQLEKSYIDEKEYKELKKLLRFNYYDSSKDGRYILKKGHVCDFANNRIKER